MKAYSLALVLVRATALLAFFNGASRVIYSLFIPFFQPHSTEYFPGQEIFFTLLTPTVVTLVWLGILFFAPKIASYIASSTIEVPEADPYAYLRTGIRLIGLWCIIVHAPVIPSFMFANSVSALHSMFATVQSIQEAWLGVGIGFFLLIFAPQLTRLFSRQDEIIRINALVAEQLANRTSDSPDSQN